MKKQLILFSLLFLLSLLAFGQKTLQVSKIDVSAEIRKDLGENEAIVKIESNVPLTFESTWDKQIIFFKPKYTRKGYFVEELKFSTGENINRELIIKSEGYKSYYYTLKLQSREILGLRVLSSESDQWACYYEHLNKGDGFFQTAQYNEAKESYLEAKKCNNIPSENNLEKKIEDVDACSAAKIFANSYFLQSNFVKAMQEYEKIVALNPNDNYAKSRIIICQNAEDNRLAVEKAAEEKKLAELKAQEEKEVAERKAKEEQLRAEAEEKRLAELKAEEERKLAELKAVEERKLAELKAQEEKEIADRKAKEEQLKAEAEEKRLAEQKAEEERKLAEQKAIEEEKNRIKQRAMAFLERLPYTVEVGSSGGEKTFSINHDETPWEVSNIPSWCSIEKKDNLLILNCEPNTNPNTREGNFEVRVGDLFKKVLIKQNKWVLFLELSDQIIKFGKSGGKNNLTVSTNASSWSISTEIDWCSTIISNNSISFFCDTNSTAHERNGTLTIIAGNESKTIKITQIDISNLEKGYWKQVLKNAISYRATTYSDALFKGSQNGLGVYYWPSDKQSYWGELQNKKSSGKGIHILEKDDMSFPGCPNCKYYAGNWSSDEINGLGKCYDKTGELIYSDLFYKAKPVEKYPQLYDGFQKFECIEYENGDIYLGETYKGLRDGLGIFFWENGDTWYGEWKENKRNGNGIEYPYDGVFKAGQWEDENDVPIQSFRKNLEQKSAIVVSSPKYTNKGSKVYLNETLVPINEVRELMANTTALQLYDKGILYNKTGNYLLYSGGGLFTVGLITFIPSHIKGSEAGENTGVSFIVIGAAAIFPGVALKLIGIKNIEKSVKMYNKTKSAHAELKCGFTGNGVGVTLGF